MKSACLRIRFSPLQQSFHQENSKCCLEIVPEVSCLENFENIQWKQSNNSIEYTIPVTYKVILKKKEIIRKSVNDLEDKTYHSCVELLLPSSLTNMHLDSIDDTSMKILSDTLILKKMSTEVNAGLLTSGKFNADIKNTDEIEGVQSQVNENEIMIKLLPVEVTKINDTHEIATNKKIKGVKDVSSQVNQIVNTLSDCKSKNSLIVTNSECLLRNCCTSTNITPFMSTIDQFSSNGNKDVSKYKLSLTPICSNNIEDNILDAVITMTSNFKINYVKDPKIFYVVSVDKINKSGYIKHQKYPSNVINSRLNTLAHKANVRILPEVRIAQFVQIMRNEILPLKIMLDNIMYNCASLGLTWKEKAYRTYKLYKTVSRYKTEKSKCSRMESKSNRVVYSMVFDE